jgi:hypothetical protein
MSSFDDVNEHADQLGGNWFKFKEVGDTFAVRLTSMAKREQRDYETGTVKLTRKTKQPRWEWVVTGMAADGNLAKTALNEGAQSAASAARKKSGAASFQPGGWLSVTYVSDSKPDGAKFAYKDFTAEYRPPEQPFTVEESGGAPLAKGVESVL